MSSEIEKEEQPKKRRWMFIDSDMSNSDVDVMTVSPSPHVNHKHSITDRKTEEKQEATVTGPPWTLLFDRDQRSH